jgi:peptidoglycan/LPS O-acetylase OafA/YrhL
LRRIAIAVICLSPPLRLFLSRWNVDLYSNTLTRLDGLMAGALLATVVRSSEFVPSRFVRKAWMLFLIATPLALLTDWRGNRWLVFSMSMAASVALVYLALYSGKKWLQRLFTTRFIVYSGTISYGLYLLHKLPFNLAHEMGLDTYPILAFPILFAACYGVAALSWTLLEKPCLKLKRFFEPRPVRSGDAEREYAIPRPAGRKFT